MFEAPSYACPQQLFRGRIHRISISLMATVSVADVVDGTCTNPIKSTVMAEYFLSPGTKVNPLKIFVPLQV